MKLVTIKASKLSAYTADPEMLQKSTRPCVLVLRLKYKGRRYDFGVPIRSNINASTPKDQYFPLPPRSSTRPKNRHGIHYAKMFPIDRTQTIIFRTKNNPQATLMKQIIDRNEKRIVRECQDYLLRYEAGNIPNYATDIDFLLTLL